MSGFAEPDKRGVYAYLTASADTTITTAGTFVPILGTFENNPIEGFSLGANAIVYDGPEYAFEIVFTSTLAGDSNGISACIGASKSGEVLATTGTDVVCTYLKTTGENYTLAGLRVVTLIAGDTIQLQCTTDGDGDVLTFAHFNTKIRRFFA